MVGHAAWPHQHRKSNLFFQAHIVPQDLDIANAERFNSVLYTLLASQSFSKMFYTIAKKYWNRKKKTYIYEVRLRLRGIQSRVQRKLNTYFWMVFVMPVFLDHLLWTHVIVTITEKLNWASYQFINQWSTACTWKFVVQKKPFVCH